MTAPDDPIRNLVDTPPRLPVEVSAGELAGLTLLPLGMIVYMMPGTSMGVATLASLVLTGVLSRGAGVWVGPWLDRWVRQSSRPRRRRTD